MFKKYIKRIYKTRLKKINEKNNLKMKKERDKYIFILNHDVKTTLLAQIQALELYLDDKAPKDILYQLLNSNYFLYEIVKNAIFLSNYKNKTEKLKYEKVDITNRVSDICKSVENYARFKNQRIVIKTNSKNIFCNADKNITDKIIRNILTSAISYGYENSDIEVFVKESKDKISFCAKNKSVYMTKEKIKNILNSEKTNDFNQLGMSLNLNIANKLISAQNWDIVAHSSKNNSNTLGFIVTKSKH